MTAEEAMGELWGSAEFDCDPDNFEWMIEEAIKAVRYSKRIELFIRKNKELSRDGLGATESNKLV